VTTDLVGWCRDHLGSEPRDELFRAGYLSEVVGVRLADGREVVVKLRPPAPRLHACFEVQRHLFDAGFPCPEPLVSPTPLGERVANAERYVAGGEPLPSSGRDAQISAHAFAQLMALMPTYDAVSSLAPTPPWAGWDHNEGGLWPWPDDRDVDLNAVDGPRRPHESSGTATGTRRTSSGRRTSSTSCTTGTA
jgi:hypothetical protein